MAVNVAEFISVLRKIRDVIYPEVNTAYENAVDLNTSINEKKVDFDSKYSSFNQDYEEFNQDLIEVGNLANSAQASASSANQSAQTATTKSNEIKAVTAQSTTLSPGSQATANYNPVDGKITIGVPSGLKGDKGDSFTVNAAGNTAERSTYDTQPTGFSFLDIQLALIYFKLSSTSGNWSTGSPFGKGDKGDDGDTGNGISGIVFLSTTHASGLSGQSGGTDTYRITYTNTTTFDFIVHNGSDVDVSNIVTIANDETITGLKEFTKSPKIPNGVAITDAVNKSQLNLGLNSLFIKPKKNEPLFIKVSPSQFKIPAGFICTINSDYTMHLLSDITITVGDGAQFEGKDYYVYANSNGTITYSSIKTEDTSLSKLIGGFHKGLTGLYEAPSGNKTEADMIKIRGINAYSFWDLKFFAKNKDNRGMICNGKAWYDIYLGDEDYGINGYSRYNAKIAGGGLEFGRRPAKVPLVYGGDGTTTYGWLTPLIAYDLVNSAKKDLISYREFTDIAYGVQEGFSFDAPSALTGHIYQLTSRYGIEQATGVQSIFSSDIGTSLASSWGDIANGRGQIYQNAYIPTLGGNHFETSGGTYPRAGSRNFVSNQLLNSSQYYIGFRGKSDMVIID